MRRIGKLLVIILLMSMDVLAEVQVTSDVDAKTVSLGDYIHLTVSIRSDKNVQIQAPTLPDIKGLALVSQSESMQSQTIFNGGSLELIRTKQFIYQLQASKQGEVKIPAIEVNVSGKEYNTKAIKIKVLKAGAIVKQPRKRRRTWDPFEEMQRRFRQMEEDSADQEFLDLLRKRRAKPLEVVPIDPKEAFSVRLELDKEKAYVGEQVTASYYLYLPRENVIRNFDNLKFPSLKGFWKEDIEVSTRLTFEQVVVNGRLYGKALLASYALFPLKNGRPVVDSYKVKCTVQKNNIFAGRAYTYTKASEDKKVNVLPLPSEAKPLNFTGAVGKFNINTSVDAQNAYKSFEPFAFNIRVEGQGNAKVIELPEINFPEHIKIYDQKEETKFFKNGKSYKDFTLYLIAEKAGPLLIPAVELSYFDPETAQYKKAASKELNIDIVKGNASSNRQVQRPDAQEKTVEKNKDIPTLFTETIWSPLLSPMVEKVVLVILLILSLISLFFKAARELSWWRSEEDLLKLLDKRVDIAKEAIKNNDTKELGIVGTNMIYQILGEVIGEGGSSEVIEKVLQKLSPSLRREVEVDLKTCLEKYQLLGFAPVEMLGPLKEAKEQKKLVNDSFKILKKIVKSEVFVE